MPPPDEELANDSAIAGLIRRVFVAAGHPVPASEVDTEDVVSE